MKRLLVLALFALPVLPVSAWAAPPSAQASTNATAACKAQRAQIGETAFAQAWGTLGRCVTSLARVEQQNLDAARAACTAEQNDPNFAATHEGKTFTQFYGSGPSGKNAFARCVSTKAKASSRAEGQARPNPARLCRTERTAMTPAVFTQTYGGAANAFGKCVSAKAKAQTQNEMAAATTCRAEQADAAAFGQAYGTNANAFGKCVSAKAKAQTQAQQQATIKAAKACAAEQKASPAAFKAKYGTFGRCVSQQRTAD
ncbi:MAG: hypothetical protein WD067_09220 [Gaiellaceae bacterium]